MNSKKRGFCAIFGHFEVPRDGFNSNRIRIIAFISKRLAENFCCMVKVLHFLPNLKGQVVWSLPSDIWPGGSYSTPWRGLTQPDMAQNFEKFWKVKTLDILILILILKTTVSKYWFRYWYWKLHIRNIDFDIDIELFGNFDIDIGIDIEKKWGKYWKFE